MMTHPLLINDHDSMILQKRTRTLGIELYCTYCTVRSSVDVLLSVAGLRLFLLYRR
jgi:hypothetical protein